MKFEVFNFENVTSTNDVAIKLIKENQKKMDVFVQEFKPKEEELEEKNGFLREEIYLFLYFFL